MARHTHGLYNAATGLPENAMQSVGSGYNTWLNGQVLRLFGPVEGQRLIDISAQHGSHRYAWLCSDVLAKNGYQSVVDEYHKRRLASAAQSRLRDHQRRLELMRERLTSTQVPSEMKYFQREIAKCQKYIEERTEKVKND